MASPFEFLKVIFPSKEVTLFSITEQLSVQLEILGWRSLCDHGGYLLNGNGRSKHDSFGEHGTSVLAASSHRRNASPTAGHCWTLLGSSCIGKSALVPTIAESLCSLLTRSQQTDSVALFLRSLSVSLALLPAGILGTVWECTALFWRVSRWALKPPNSSTLFSGCVPCAALIQDAYCWDWGAAPWEGRKSCWPIPTK